MGRQFCGALMLIGRGWSLGLEPQKDKEAQGGVASYLPHSFPGDSCSHHPLLCHWWWLLGTFLMGLGGMSRFLSWDPLIQLLGCSSDELEHSGSVVERVSAYKNSLSPRLFYCVGLVSSSRFLYLHFLMCHLRWLYYIIFLLPPKSVTRS